MLLAFSVHKYGPQKTVNTLKPHILNNQAKPT